MHFIHHVKTYRVQEKEAEALGQAPEVESEKEEEVEPDSGSSSSEEMYGFGFQSSKTKKTTKTNPSSSTGRGGGKRGVAKRPPPADQDDSLVAKANETMQLLDRISPLAIWQGSLKEKDVEVKLSKAFSLVGQISASLEVSDKCKKVGTDLEKLAERVTEVLGAIGTLKTTLASISTDGNATNLMLDDADMKKVVSLPYECLTGVLTQAGKNLSEAMFCWKHFRFQKRFDVFFTDVLFIGSCYPVSTA